MRCFHAPNRLLIFVFVVRMGKSFGALRCRSKSVDQRFPGYHAKCTVLGSTPVMNGATMFCQRSKRPCVKAIVHTEMKREDV